jgi:hypothetical protein
MHIILLKWYINANFIIKNDILIQIYYFMMLMVIHKTISLYLGKFDGNPCSLNIVNVPQIPK